MEVPFGVDLFQVMAAAAEHVAGRVGEIELELAEPTLIDGELTDRRLVITLRSADRWAALSGAKPKTTGTVDGLGTWTVPDSPEGL